MTVRDVTSDPDSQALAKALGAQYEVVRLLGRGGMGAVYLAREPFLEREVAVKVLPSELASGDARERFLREARTAARLSHPNIVPLYTFGHAGELLYYVMGYVEGESLEARLKREGRLSPDETRRITSELADALDYAHQSGVVHRDVKPDNVLLDRVTGRAMLTDFGIAKQRAGLETLTGTGIIVGTPHYMSPEQASGDRDLDGRSDLYSLGVIAYRMATGRLPFEGSALREVLVQHATRVPVPPSQLQPSVPLDLDTVISRALSKDPSDRWPNGRAMREALSPDSEESLPESLRDISGMGCRLLVIGAALAQTGFLVEVFNWWGGAFDLAMYGLGSLVQLLGLAGLIVPARRYGWRTALAAYFRQPEWWKSWWPRASRRAGDVWDRLPADLRHFRMAGAASMLSNIVLLNGLAITMASDVLAADGIQRDPLTGFLRVAMAFYVVSFGALMTLAVRTRRRLRKLGLPKRDADRLLNEPTFTNFWSRPHVAVVLSPSGHHAHGAPGKTPEHVLADIGQMARLAQGSPHQELFREAVDAAETIAAALAKADEELRELARDSDPVERRRIEESLAALGPAGEESAAKREMRALLERQLELIRELDSRRAQVADRRAHLEQQLRTLALHLASLRAASDAPTASDISGRIRSVMREVDYRLSANAEVRSVLRG